MKKHKTRKRYIIAITSKLNLQLKLGPPPVTALGVISDLIVGHITDPGGNWPIHLHLFSMLQLDPQGFVGLQLEFRPAVHYGTLQRRTLIYIERKMRSETSSMSEPAH